MQQSDFDHIELSPTSCLDQLDAALYRLEMLATGTELRRQYLKEIRNKNIANNNNNKLSNMIRINTNYVSTVSIGLRQIAPFTTTTTTTKAAIRYKPYMIKERLRTRSENNDNGEIVDNQKLEQQQEKQHDDNGDDDLITELKKAKSLESILAENSQQSDQIDLNNIKIDCNQILSTATTTDMEIVSNSIQNLKVNE